jgi:3-hydroxyisobutyrate dehydrogenase
MTTRTEKLGFIGIGNMGQPMTRNLVRAGFSVTVFDADAAKAAAFAAAEGMASAATAAGLAGVDIVITMLPDGHAVRSALMDGGGVVEHLREGALVIDMSSSDPVGTQTLGPELAARGVGFIDAPVSGAVMRATDGTLTIMVGADDPSLVARARPVLSAMGREVVTTGPLGSGHAMKALNNYVAATAFASTSEALIVGERFGLDPAKMVEIMNTSTARNFMTDVVMKPHVIDGAFATGFALALLAKDVGIAEDLAASLGLDTPMLRKSSEMWREARNMLGPQADNTEAYKAWKRRAGAEDMPNA